VRAKFNLVEVCYGTSWVVRSMAGGQIMPCRVAGRAKPESGSISLEVISLEGKPDSVVITERC